VLADFLSAHYSTYDGLCERIHQYLIYSMQRRFTSIRII
jgi:hypothetical protein